MALNGVTLNFGPSEHPMIGDVIIATVSPPNAEVTYQWYRGSSAISGATESSYQTTPTDKNNTIKCTVTETATQSSVTSDATAVVSSMVTLKATAISQTEIKLTWYDTGSTVNVHRSTSVASGYSSIGYGAGVFIDKPPVSGRKYYYKLINNNTDFSLPVNSYVVRISDYNITTQKTTISMGNDPIVFARIEDTGTPIVMASVSDVTYDLYKTSVQALGQVKTREKINNEPFPLYDSTDDSAPPVITANVIKDENWTMDDKGYNFLTQLNTINDIGTYEARIMVTTEPGYGRSFAFIIPIVVE